MSKRVTRSSRGVLQTPDKNGGPQGESVSGCRHTSSVVIDRVRKIVLDPTRWACNECGTTEGVWACLKCGEVGCGRYQQSHAQDHFELTGHALALEINSKYCFCYKCSGYVDKDNPHGDIQTLRTLLEEAQTHSLSESTTRSGRVLRPLQLIHSTIDDFNNMDKMNTAENHHKINLLRKIMREWRGVVDTRKESGKRLHEDSDDEAGPSNNKGKEVAPSTTDGGTKDTAPKVALPRASTIRLPITLRGRSIVPGITGLRNLGNTCFMNTVLQALSNLDVFREFFVHILGAPPEEGAPAPTAEVNGKLYTRQATLECLRAVRNNQSFKVLDEVSLSMQMHALLRVLWSGKWSVVTPFALLQALWKFVPRFRNYQQQDAQEFLCCLLDRLHTELNASVVPFINDTFQGKLLNEVVCSHCGWRSRRTDPFLDLSLDIPLVSLAKPKKTKSRRKQKKEEEPDADEASASSSYGRTRALTRASGTPTTPPATTSKAKAKATPTTPTPASTPKGKAKTSAGKGKGKAEKADPETMEDADQDKKRKRTTAANEEEETEPPVCTLQECLDGLVRPEDLPGQIWSCDKCQCKRDATKRMSLATLPPVLCVVLKRFFWTATTRAKIDTRVTLPFELDMAPYLASSLESAASSSSSSSSSKTPSLFQAPHISEMYDLRSVVLHHGAGLGCGHYTAYAYNDAHGGWVHYNDSRVAQAEPEDVQHFASREAYIVFYQHRELDNDSFASLLPSLMSQASGFAASVK
eukprot:TRINITY_DN3705_c0_g1_i2.p1 TRINITY_DN3705_c0_g1~~TRINITY_DN3705_c0_g1_i2.p1  ORF type:complete len:752 (-),score=192.83 TRINITY_DN3705_c0_g1_i2:16-2271(-)